MLHISVKPAVRKLTSEERKIEIDVIQCPTPTPKKKKKKR